MKALVDAFRSYPAFAAAVEAQAWASAFYAMERFEGAGLPAGAEVHAKRWKCTSEHFHYLDGSVGLCPGPSAVVAEAEAEAARLRDQLCTEVESLLSALACEAGAEILGCHPKVATEVAAAVRAAGADADADEAALDARLLQQIRAWI